MGSIARPFARVVARVVAPVLALVLALALVAPEPRAEEAEQKGGSPLLGEEVTFSSGDGVELQADLYAAADPNAPTVILLHAHRKDRTTWSLLVPDLTRAGFNVLNLDLRGHGGSTRQGDAVIDADDVPVFLTTGLIVDSAKDVVSSLLFLRERGIQTDRMTLIGDTYGAMVAFLAAGAAPSHVRSLVLLSPPQAAWGINVRTLAGWYPGRIMAVVDPRDPVAASGTRLIVDLHPGDDIHLLYDGGGRGTALLETRPQVRPRIVEFVERTLDAG
jgi:pimeloyl-ACP methyl ester carboxylesterase